MATLARGFFTFGGLTLVSRVAGFVRDMLTAAYLGAGPLADAFVVAQRLPNLFRTLFAEGAFSAAFVPAFARAQHQHGTPAARRFAEEVQSVLASLLLVFTAVMMAAMPWVIMVVAPGFSDEPVRYALAVSLGLITFPYLPLITLTALQGGVLNSIGRNGPFAAAPIILNIVQIVALLAVVPLAGKPGHVLAWGMTAGGLLQFAFLAWHCRRAGLSIGWRMPRVTEDVKDFFRKLLPGIIGGSATQLNLVASTVLASLLPTGAVAYLYYADRLNQLPLGVVGIALYTTLLPLLAKAVHAGEAQTVRYTTGRAVDLALVFGLPAAAALATLGAPILYVLFARGAFTAADAAATAQVLACYSLCIPAFMLVRICAARFQASGDTRTPARIGILAVAANIAFSVWLMQWAGAMGIALATSLATWVNFGFLRWRLAQRDGPLLDVLARRRAWRFALSTVVMAALCWSMAQGVSPWLYSTAVLKQLAALGFVMLTGLVAYGAMLRVTGAVDASMLAILKRSK